MILNKIFAIGGNGKRLKSYITGNLRIGAESGPVNANHGWHDGITESETNEKAAFRCFAVAVI